LAEVVRAHADNSLSRQSLNLTTVNHYFALQNKYIRPKHLAFAVIGTMVANNGRARGSSSRSPVLNLFRLGAVDGLEAAQTETAG
jgi:hypothetical protein